MYAGRIIEEGPAVDVFHDPKHPYTAALAAAFPEIGDDRFRASHRGSAGTRPTRRMCRRGARSTPRCPLAFEDCSTVDPHLYDAGQGRRAACLLVDAARSDVTEAPA